jgi:hypothetical protein
MWSIDLSHPYGPSRPVTRIALLLLYICTVHYWGKDGTLRTPPFRYFSWHREFAFYQDFKFSVREEEAIGLMRLVENSNSHNLCSRPEWHVSKAFSISKTQQPTQKDRHLPSWKRWPHLQTLTSLGANKSGLWISTRSEGRKDCAGEDQL